MPAGVQAVTHIVPARYFLVALRSIVLKGAGLGAFWQEMMALAIFATVALTLASLRLRRGMGLMKRVLHLIRKELLELKRDPRLFSVVIMAPIVQLMVLGYAATTDVKDIPIVIVDADRSTASRQLVQRFETSQNFKIVGMLGSTSDIDPYLDGGEAWMAISIPPDYGRKIASGRQTTLQIVADGTDANSTGVAMGYAQMLIAGYLQDLIAAAAPAAPAGGLVRPEVRVWFNPRLESREFMIPGLSLIHI